MKKMIAVLICVIMFAGTGITAHAQHVDGRNPSMYCTNTGTIWEDNVRAHAYTKTHGYSCTVTCYIYTHRTYCSACTTCLGDGPTYQCTEVHTCGSYLKDCGVQH